MGADINSAMRLCAVAIINNEVTHAEVARQGIEYWRRDAVPKNLSRDTAGEDSHLIGTCHDRTIARCMLKMMDDIYGIAAESAAMMTADNAPRRSTTATSRSLRSIQEQSEKFSSI
jgi:hypothetical protein